METALAEIELDDFLAHHGVKGMRWGHRTKVGSDVKVARKMARKAGRREINENFKARYDISSKAGSGGQRAKNAARGLSLYPDIIATGGMYTGSQIARAGGHSKGKSAAIGILTGPVGATLFNEVKLRKSVKAAIR